MKVGPMTASDARVTACCKFSDHPMRVLVLVAGKGKMLAFYSPLDKQNRDFPFARKLRSDKLGRRQRYGILATKSKRTITHNNSLPGDI